MFPPYCKSTITNENRCIEADARCINLSLALAQPSSKGERELEQVLDYATKRGVIIVAAAGNQGTPAERRLVLSIPGSNISTH